MVEVYCFHKSSWGTKEKIGKDKKEIIAEIN
jgi:hypothetical protein